MKYPKVSFALRSKLNSTANPLALQSVATTSAAAKSSSFTSKSPSIPTISTSTPSSNAPSQNFNTSSSTTSNNHVMNDKSANTTAKSTSTSISAPFSSTSTNVPANGSVKVPSLPPPSASSSSSSCLPGSRLMKMEESHSRQVNTSSNLQFPAEFLTSSSIYYRKPGNLSVVGSGTYGKVFRAVHIYTRQLVALKKIRMEGERDGFPVTAIREVKLLQTLNHPNIVKLIEVMVERNDCFMVFEYLSHDLTGLLNHPTLHLESSHHKHLAYQLFLALDYLHRRGVLHRDIKAANILVSSDGQLKVADFGLARFYGKRAGTGSTGDYTNRVITIWYRAPELLLGETRYDGAVDIWSAGCVLMEMFTRQAIFAGDGSELSQIERICSVLGTPSVEQWPGLRDMLWYELLLMATPTRPNRFHERYAQRLTPAAFDLLAKIFSFDPAQRPTASHILDHHYFNHEEPKPCPPEILKDLEGDWHEFESKAVRRERKRRAEAALVSNSSVPSTVKPPPQPLTSTQSRMSEATVPVSTDIINDNSKATSATTSGANPEVDCEIPRYHVSRPLSRQRDEEGNLSSDLVDTSSASVGPVVSTMCEEGFERWKRSRRD